MLSPAIVQIAVILLTVLSVGGVGVAMLYPRLAGGTPSDKRKAAIAAPIRKTMERNAAVDEGRRRRSVEDTLKELEAAQKAKARRSQKPTLINRLRQAGLSWSKRTYYLICVGSAFGVFLAAHFLVR